MVGILRPCCACFEDALPVHSVHFEMSETHCACLMQPNSTLVPVPVNATTGNASPLGRVTLSCVQTNAQTIILPAACSPTRRWRLSP